MFTRAESVFNFSSRSRLSISGNFDCVDAEKQIPANNNMNSNFLNSKIQFRTGKYNINMYLDSHLYVNSEYFIHNAKNGFKFH